MDGQSKKNSSNNKFWLYVIVILSIDYALLILVMWIIISFINLGLVIQIWKMWNENDNSLSMRETTMFLILEAIKSDDELTRSELEYIDDARKQLGLTGEAVKALNMAPDNKPLSIPSDEKNRMTILYYVLFALKSDEKITIEEEELCYKISLKLGFSTMMIRDLLDVLKSNLNQEVPPEQMIENVKKYLN